MGIADLMKWGNIYWLGEVREQMSVKCKEDCQ